MCLEYFFFFKFYKFIISAWSHEVRVACNETTEAGTLKLDNYTVVEE